MKTVILCSLFGVLALLLTNSPMDAKAMDSGIMSGRDYRGFDMEPGMMHADGYRGYDMGPGMMGQDYQHQPHYLQDQKYLDRNSAERIFKDYLTSRHNPNLKLGEIKDEGASFEADLLSKDNSLVDRLIVDKDTGRMRSAY